MRFRLPRGALTLMVVAVVAATAGASGMYAVLEFGPWVPPPQFSATFENASIAQVPLDDFTHPVLNATLDLSSPSTLDPSGLSLTITGPGPLMVYDCLQIVWVHSIHEIYVPNTYPHWEVTFTSPGAVSGPNCFWTGYSVFFTNPNGAIVGGLNASLPEASVIDSGAMMSLWFPGGSGFSLTGAGFTITVAYSGHSGVAALTTT